MVEISFGRQCLLQLFQFQGRYLPHPDSLRDDFFIAALDEEDVLVGGQLAHNITIAHKKFIILMIHLSVNLLIIIMNNQELLIYHHTKPNNTSIVHLSSRIPSAPHIHPLYPFLPVYHSDIFHKLIWSFSSCNMLLTPIAELV